MARTIRDSNLETRAARGRLKPNREPFYRGLEPGLHLGYRKPRSGAGKWLARRNDEGKYSYHPLGTADDFSDPDGTIILSYKQAQDAARKVQVGRGVGTVADAMKVYLDELETEGRSRKAIERTRYNVDVHILPVLGHIELAKLTTDQIKRWQAGLVRKPARVRTRKGEAQRYRDHGEDEDARRARRVSANRIRVVLNAALNRAFRAGHVDSDLAWRRIQPFKGVDKARVRYLTTAEAKRLINAADPEFRPLLQGALLVGARYGQLGQLVASDFDPDGGTLRLRTKKGDGSEYTFFAPLTDEAREFFRAICAGKRGDELVFAHANGRPWGKSHQEIPMLAASQHARIDPPINFHALRHSYASHAAMRGVPLLVIAMALGHKDTRMVEKHYGHLSPSYAAKEIREKAPTFGITVGNIRSLHGKA